MVAPTDLLRILESERVDARTALPNAYFRRFNPSDVLALEWASNLGASELLKPLLVKVTKDGGVAGSSAANCTFTYTVTDLTGTELGTLETPLVPRFPLTEYDEPTAESLGIAYYASDGALVLYHVAEEIPTTNLLTAVSAVRYDTATHKFQYKTTSIRVLESATESGWTDIVALTECDDT